MGRGARRGDGPVEGPGLLDAARRVGDRLIASPAFRDTVETLIRAIDPGSAPALARTLVGRDPILAAAVLSALPRAANAAVALADALLGEVERSFPEATVRGFVDSLAAEVDRERLASLGARLDRLRALVGPALEPLADAFRAGRGGGVR